MTAPVSSVAIVGGGIVGLATAYQLLRRGGPTRVTVLEKESRVGAHQSTHNSGVLHAGLHYTPGSLKARLAREGLRLMIEFCREHAIPHEQCGKLVVATSALERDRLRDLLDRGTRNGLRDLRWIEGSAGLRQLEPRVTGIAGLHVPEEGIVDYDMVCRTLREQIVALGGEVRTSVRVVSLEPRAAGWTIESTAGAVEAAALITCGGLHSDRLARMAGERVETRIVPFRGEYWTLRPERAHLVRNLIYPVPDPAFPFLGVHFTRMIHGGIEAGPNAVLALAREGYRWSNFSIRDAADALSYAGLWQFIRKYPRIATYEVARSLSRRLFLRSLQTLVPDLEASDLVRGPSGVRAQAMTRQGVLLQDFEIVASRRAVHVVNAPSPAATASLAIGRAVLEHLDRVA